MRTGATFRVACMACGRGHDSFAAKEARKWILCKLTGEMKADTTPHDASASSHVRKYSVFPAERDERRSTVRSL